MGLQDEEGGGTGMGWVVGSRDGTVCVEWDASTLVNSCTRRRTFGSAVSALVWMEEECRVSWCASDIFRMRGSDRCKFLRQVLLLTCHNKMVCLHHSMCCCQRLLPHLALNFPFACASLPSHASQVSAPTTLHTQQLPLFAPTTPLSNILCTHLLPPSALCQAVACPSPQHGRSRSSSHTGRGTGGCW